MAVIGNGHRSCEEQFDALPARLEQRPSRSAAIAAGLLGLVAVGASTASIILAGSHTAAADAMAMFSARPLAAAQVSLGLLVLTALIVLPLARLVARAGKGKVVDITATQVSITERGLFGARAYQAPLASYLGVMRRVRTTLSSVRHEVILVHRDRRYDVVLCDDAARTASTLENATRLLGLPEVDHRAINRGGARRALTAIAPATEPARA